MGAMRRVTFWLSVLLVLTSGSTAVLALLLLRKDRSTTGVRHKAWRSCRKLSMQHLRYEQARARAKYEERKLVVIGNPSGGWVNRVVPIYGCGDVCIDLNGCKPCPRPTRVMRMDAVKALRQLPTDSAVVFESETLEYVGDMRAAVFEIDRITGHDHTRVYAVHSIAIDPWPYHTMGRRPPVPTSAIKKRRRKRRKKYQRYGEGLARRIIYRFPPRDRYGWVEL